MVCQRCILAVQNTFSEAGYSPVNVILGQVELDEVVRKEDLNGIRDKLNKLGFEIIDDKNSRVIEEIKGIIISLIQNDSFDSSTNLSSIINSKMNKDYNYLSNLFSSVEGITIEKYFINQKIERVKELLVYDELTLSEIAYKLGYSSVAHLSTQFKKITGLTPSHFKGIGNYKRKPLDEV